MKRHDPPLEPELEALLRPRRIKRRAPAEVRARALARGRAIVAAGGRISPVLEPELLAPVSVPVARHPALVRVAWVASVAVLVGAVGAVAALRNRAAHTPPTALSPSAPPSALSPSALSPSAAPSATVQDAFADPPMVTAPTAASAMPTHPARATGDAAPFAAELELLARAQTAYTHRDFSHALVLVAEHARRFPNGHLAEEREALRVRSLQGSGRSDEARRAAAAFALRFPRSVLLPRVEGSETSR